MGFSKYNCVGVCVVLGAEYFLVVVDILLAVAVFPGVQFRSIAEAQECTRRKSDPFSSHRTQNSDRESRCIFHFQVRLQPVHK